MILDIKPISQRDPRWAAQRLGTVNGTTIGYYGCLITCMTMIANYYGHPILPNEMDDWLTAHGGYVSGNLYDFSSLHREFPDCHDTGNINCGNIPAPLTQIDQQLNLKCPVVVEVDFDHDATDGIQTHFVLLVGKNDAGHYICNDPWYGDQVDFNDRYGEPSLKILQCNFFSGTIPNSEVITQPTTQPFVNVYTDQTVIPVKPVPMELQALNSKLAELATKDQQINSLKSEIDVLDQHVTKLNNDFADDEKEIMDLKQKLDDSQTKINELNTKLFNMSIDQPIEGVSENKPSTGNVTVQQPKYTNTSAPINLPKTPEDATIVFAPFLVSLWNSFKKILPAN